MRWLVACDRTALDSLGGMTVTLLETARRFISDGDRVTWLTGRLNDSIPPEGVIDGIEVISHPSFGTGFRDLRRLRSFFAATFDRLLREGGFDAAVVHQPIAGDALGGRLRTARIPAGYFFHSPWAREYRIQSGVRGLSGQLAFRLRHRIERRAVLSFDRVMVFSRTMADFLRADHPPAPAPTRITPGIDLERFRPVADRDTSRQRLGWPGPRTLLLTLRRLVPRMGVDMLIEAFALVCDRHPEAILLIGGAGPMREELEAGAEQLGIAERIRFLGYLPDGDVAAAFGTADLFITPTRELEGLGLVTLEAMACGTAAVATPVGGNVEVVEPFDPGLLAPEASAAGLATVLDEILAEGRERLRARGAAAREHVTSRYGWERTAADIRSLIGGTTP